MISVVGSALPALPLLRDHYKAESGTIATHLGDSRHSFALVPGMTAICGDGSG